jgi:uncharacterized protein YndB with AHSA1/START domain
MPQIKVEQLVKGSPEYAYMAFTNSTVLREWLCDMATASARINGRIYLWWNGDYYSSGVYTALDPNKLVAFTWFGRGEPASTQVTVKLVKKRGGTLIKLIHKVPSSAKWKEHAEGFAHEWKNTLENLASIMETGKDLRIVNRPMLGIGLSDFNAEIAEKLGVPVKEGLRISDTLAGMGAHDAGLRKDDVLVGMGGHEINNTFESLVAALQGKKGGDKVSVEFYRGPEKKTVTMELSRRPVPDVPFEPKKLAEAARALRAESHAKLAQCFEGVTEAEAAFQPAPGEWSARETLAHLIHGERYNTISAPAIMSGFEPWTDGESDNFNAAIAATVKAYPTTKLLLEELDRLSAEILAFIAAMPKDQAARKGSYFRLGWQLLNPDVHADAHMEQIKAAINAARAGK